MSTPPTKQRSAIAQVLGGLGWPLVLGAGACSGFYLLIHRGPLNSEAMHRYFSSHPVSYAATAMFFVGMAALLLKLLHVVSQTSAGGRVSSR